MPDLKILAPHPIQYQVPVFRALVEAGIDLEVGFYHQGTAGHVGYDTEFGIDIKWDIDLLSGYSYRIMSGKPATYSLREQIRLSPKLLAWALHDRKTPLLLMGWFAHIVWLVWLIRIVFRMPVIMTCETTSASFEFTPKPRWRQAVLRWLLRRTAACLYIGNRNYQFLKYMGASEERLFHAPYSVDNARFTEEARRLVLDRRTLCARYGLDPNLPVFLFVGKLTPKKHPLELLEAYLAAGLADCAQLLYVGEGQLRRQLEERVQLASASHVKTIGFLNQTQMPMAYVLGEVLCLISDPTETWGLVVNEALACGCPVIVTETVGCAPDLVGSKNGWVIPLDDHEALTQVLIEAYRRRGEWAVMGQFGQTKMAEHTFSKMAEQVKRALEGLK